MINEVIVCDRNDKVLGEFFSLCKDFVIEKTSPLLPNTKELYPEDIDLVNFSNHLIGINQYNFLFLGFVHGNNETMFINESEKFISTTDNYYVLSNALIYVFSCHSGNELADKLLENNAHVFWGYSNKAWVCYDFIELFKICAMSGYNHFILGCSIEDAEKKMKSEINHQIDILYNISMFAASKLMENLDKMIIKGNKTLTIQDFVLK